MGTYRLVPTGLECENVSGTPLSVAPYVYEFTLGCGLGGRLNPADITAVGGTLEAPLSPDGQLTVDDLVLFVNAFTESTGCPGATPCNPADITSVGGTLESLSPPDGQLTVDDLLVFVGCFSEGCGE